MHKSKYFLFAALGLGTLATAQMPGGRPTSVQVEKVQRGTDSIVRRSIGHAEAIRTVNVSTAVEGFLLPPKFEEGALVQEGEVIFEIFSNRYQAEVMQAEAKIDELDAKIRYAESRYKRLNTLSQTQASSKEEAETALATLEGLKAQKAEAEALLVQAKQDLNDCTIRAAITGRMGRNQYSAGNYIEKGRVLGSIAQIDPIYMRFPLSQSDVRDVFRGAEEIAKVSKVELYTPDGLTYPTAGEIAIVDSQLTSSTDTYSLWAEFSNPQGKLTPRGIGALLVSLNDKTEVCKVPLTAVQHDARGAFVYVIDAESKVNRRDIIAGTIEGRLQSIYKGLEEGEVVITDGSHKTRVGAQVIPIMHEEKKPDAPVKPEEMSKTVHKLARVTEATDTTILSSHGARAEAINRVELIPLVRGILAEPQFKEGDAVQKGDILFQIDPTRYQAAVDAQVARIDQLIVRQDDATNKLKRQKNLLERGATSQDELDSAEANLSEIQAQLTSAKAALIIAKDDLSRCTIRAAMDSVIGRVNVTGGNYITDSSPLATAFQISPIYVRFSLSENDILSTYNSAQNLKVQSKITLQSASGEVLAEGGRVAFYDNHIQTATDTQNFWAVFDNKDGSIRPGSVLSLGVKRQENISVPCLPTEAILTDSRGHYVYVYSDGRAHFTRIICGSETTEGHRAVFSGVELGDLIIIDGLAELEDGQAIHAQELQD